ncbi:MAG: hypothetical protein FWD28_06400 [Treponema sp.]|nr:hypothetical protein [Treponema sp.]
MIILPIFYGAIPNDVPAFVDFFGNTIVSMEKSYLSILRLPIMGLLLSIICIIMYKINLSGENGKFNKIIWSIAAFIGSLKMGITSMEILFYENMEIINIFRIIITVLVIIGIMVLVYALIKMYKNKIPIEEYKIGIKNNSIKIIGILCIYIIIVFMPMYIK